MHNGLSFNDVELQIIDHDGHPWLRGSQIATALGFSVSQRITEIYTRHADEFTDTMTALLTLPTDGGEQKVRVFSLRGCHLLAMFARTKVAKDFRRWVLDVLDGMEKDKSHTTASTAPTLTLSTAADRKPLRYIVHTWAQTSGQSHAICWSMVKAAFQLTRIDDLPVEWIPDAIAWVQEKMDALQAKALPQPSLPAVRRDQKELEAFFDKYFLAIYEFNDKLSGLEKEYKDMTADVVKNAVLRMRSDRNAPFVTDDIITCIHSQHSEALKRFRDGGDLLWRSRQTICCLNQM
jgi:prophage antirepressor-like protein